MTTHQQIRASDAEREEVARAVQSAVAEGRLTLDEADERLTRVYDSRFRDELAPIVADLPAQRPQASATPPATDRRPRLGLGLGIHAAIVAVLAVVLLARWVASDTPYFWPAFPMFWLGLSLLIHARVRGWPRPTRPVPH